MDTSFGGSVKREKVKEAATALIAFHKTQKDGNEMLFGEPFKVQLQLSVWKITTKKSSTHKIKLPHRPHAGSLNVCLFVKDEPNIDSERCQALFKDKLHSKGVNNVSEVIPLKTFKKEYIPFEARRKMARSYDLFLADDRIIRLMHSNLGKEFYKRNKYPVTVNLGKTDLKKEITETIDAAYLILTHRGSCSTVTVANIGMSAKEITDNIMSAITSLKKIVPEGWSNVKSIFVRTEKSVSLPIYTSLVHEEWKQNEVEENVLDNSDITQMQTQLRFEAEEAAKKDGSDEDGEVEKKTVKRRKEDSVTPGKLAKKAKQGSSGQASTRKPTPKIGGKKKK
ncbi:ribosomal L1 domain-containing protein 1-like isoform X1 [Lytechinus pictus]|uniref:ribosomal L1 domain-containing protein 1-like isoform X1 n=2 Tax=Lytechinus pictus TaxID=7653 RepID=UPI0030B9C512